MDLTASSPRHVARVARAFRLALWLAMSTTLALGAQEKKQEKAKKEKEPADSAKVAKWKQEAEALPLFKSDEPLVLTLIADYKTVLKDRDTLSLKEYPGTLVVKDSAGAEKKIPITLRTRGHFRLASRNCAFVPLRMSFAKKDAKGTVLEGNDKLKIGTHCQGNNEYEQYVLREHLAYKVHNLVTDRSYRTRLARITYMDSVTAKSLGEHNAILFESEDDVAKRMEGRVADLRRALFDDVDAAQINQVSIFEYFIGNVDWSLYALHNIRIVRQLDGTLLPLAYDLDFSGLVGTRYATPDYRLPIKTVKERLYRGPCRTVADLEPQLTVYRDKEAQILALYDLPELDKGYARDARAFLGDFFKMIKKPRDVKSNFVDACEGKPSV
jgi:hypothetical protein